MLLGQRDVQAVVGGRGLQFEIEAAAEALAQRQSPGFVDAPAERRVDDQLHAAAFVEEALGDDRVSASAPRPAQRGLQECIRSPARRRIRRGRILPSATRRCLRPAGLLCETPTGERLRQAFADFLPQFGDLQRSSCVRAGASPRQKGTVGGAPCASSTSTRPVLPSTRRMRHEVLPSSMMSPALLSTAKSSSRVPTTVPSGSATTVNSAVSGIAPPLVIAASRLRAAPAVCGSPGRDGGMRRSGRGVRRCLRTASRRSSRKSRAKDRDRDKRA